MSRARTLLLALAGLAFPVGLGLAVYVTSASSLAAVPTVISAPEQIARSATQTEPTTNPSTAPTTTDDDRDEPRNEDLPGKCRDPDHALDPDCDPPTADDDSSGPGSGSDDSSGSDNSGSGSDSSGRGSGDD